MQHSPGMHAFPGRPDAPPLDEEKHYMSSKEEGHWQWEGVDPNGSNMPPHIYKEGKMIMFPCSICTVLFFF